MKIPATSTKALRTLPSETFSFPSGTVRMYWNWEGLCWQEAFGHHKPVYLIEEAVYARHAPLLPVEPLQVLPSGEACKSLRVVEALLSDLLAHEIDASHELVAVGGGAVLDTVAFVAAIYRRGIPCRLVPSTLLAMVDAAVGGKNGINVGPYKNMAGRIVQPRGVLFDDRLLETLPQVEWRHAFAEVVKYACVADPALFDILEQRRLSDYLSHRTWCQALIMRCVRLKAHMVIKDEDDKGERRYLNFGHTLAHAIERSANIPHGQAVALGICFASWLSVQRGILSAETSARVRALLKRYELPTQSSFLLKNKDSAALLRCLRADKKRSADMLSFVLLREIGDPCVVPMELEELAAALQAFLCASA